MGATGSHTGAASRNVAVDGARFSSHSIIGAACEPGSRSADRCYRPTRITDLGMRVDSPGSWKALHGSTCLANRAALAHCAVVRAFSALESPDSRATVLVDFVIFCYCHSDRSRDAVEASAAENHGLGIVRGVHGLRADDCRLGDFRSWMLSR